MITQGAMAVEMQQWRDGRKAAEDATEALSGALVALGIEAERVSHLRPVVAYSGRPYVHMGAMPADMVERMAEALRRDDPILPNHPEKRPARCSGTLASWGRRVARAIGPTFLYLFKGAPAARRVAGPPGPGMRPGGRSRQGDRHPSAGLPRP
ncbi:hypothetical protein GCM10010221_02820 [Streptomyces parvus]|uniref:hypothetical protein n=1 Tax=Streptomyces parvus TaxID=66428 RepID=UPI001672AC2C|nr:hypothetical protein [Streptomyces parvus]GGS10214.1 hypothetical protein GCM10010221_02820 [Streptomyces parvus]